MGVRHAQLGERTDVLLKRSGLLNHALLESFLAAIPRDLSALNCATSLRTRSDSPGRYRSLLVCAYTTTSFTSMLPRVALEYGQTMWAFCTRASTCSRGRPGTLIFSSTSMPKPVGIWPMPTVPSIELVAGKVTFCWPATYFSAPRKQAE